MRRWGMGVWALTALGLAALLWIGGWLFAGPGLVGAPGTGRWGMGPGMIRWGVGWPGGLLIGLSMLLFWLAAILGLVLLVRWVVGQSGAARSAEPDAVELARRRYARGEISREEYERLHADLTRGPVPSGRTET